MRQLRGGNKGGCHTRLVEKVRVSEGYSLLSQRCAVPFGTQSLSRALSQHLRAELMNAVASRLGGEMEAGPYVHVAGDWIRE
jgi:hypothetical protein